MAYLVHTDDDVGEMLRTVGADSMDALFADIAPELRYDGALRLASGISEADLTREFSEYAQRNADTGSELSFLGYGAYDHYVPAAVEALVARSEFATAYTPYQPEISQGTLQSIFEFQTAISELTGLPVANASLYDGATAAAEAMYLCQQVRGGSTVVVLGTVSPHVRRVLATYAWAYDLSLHVVEPDADGRVAASTLAAELGDDVSCVVIQQPNVLGLLEDAPGLCSAARAADAVPVVHADPLSLGVLEAPGNYGAGVVVGSGQPLGCGLHFGGPNFGFFAAERRFIRRMPGRIVGQSRDARGQRAYTLTLQTREQHIRREKATSNICTNQALCALAGTIYLSWLGPAGLTELGERLFQVAAATAERLDTVAGVEVLHDGPWYREVAVGVGRDANEVIADCRARGIHPGAALPPELVGGRTDVLLVAVTERHRDADIERLGTVLGEVLS